MNTQRHLTALALLVCLLVASVVLASAQRRPRKISREEQQRLNDALFTAIKRSKTTEVDPKDTEKILALLDQGADPNARDMISLHPSRQHPHPTRSMAATPLGLLIRRKFRSERNRLDTEFDPDEVVYTIIPALARENLSLVQLLIDKGADVNAKYGKLQITALHDAVQLGEYEATVRLLLARGAAVNFRDKVGRTPLMLAARRSVYLPVEQADRMLRLLIEKGADVNARDNDGRPALWHALWRGSEADQIVRLLLDRGAAVNVVTDDGSTVLRFAIGRGRLNVVRTLVEAGADIHFKDKDGKTGWRYAEQVRKSYPKDAERRAIVQYLKKAGAKE